MFYVNPKHAVNIKGDSPDIVETALKCHGANQRGWQRPQIADMKLLCVAMVTESHLNN